MKQIFSKIDHDFFKHYFWVRTDIWSVEKEYFAKAEKYLRYIAWVPWLQMVCIGNTLSMNAGKSSSDIDLYIVTEQNRLWLVRIVITFIFQLLWVRKTAHKHAGRFCLSFFSTKKGMDFSSFSLQNNDIYLYFRLVYAKPIINFNNTYESLLEKNDSWADISQYKDIIEQNKTYIVYSGTKKKSTSKLLDMVDSMFKKIFFPKTIQSYENLGRPFGIVISDDVLKFHDNDIRKKVREDFLQQKKI